MEKLAIHGGSKVRTEPFPERTPFGEREEELLLQAVRSQTLFVKSGTFVKELETEFAAFYGTQHAQASTSGTAAIHTAVGVVNPDPGDEIITAPITDPGSVYAYSHAERRARLCRCRSQDPEHDPGID